jgi:alpha-L-rhamnosidase
MADAQTDEGLVPNIAPEYVKFQGTFRAAAEWGAAFILVPWQQYEFTGDLGLLREYYPAMKRYFAYLESRATDGILAEGLGDWYDLGPAQPGVAQLTKPPVTASAFYYEDAATLARIAGLLGKADEESEYSARAARIRASYNRHFFDRVTGSYGSGSQCANALPLALGIADPADRPRVLAALTGDVEGRGATMTTGDIGYRFLLRALAEAGRSDLIYRMVDQDEKPGYGYELKQGATSLTESWDANLNSSHDHFMLGEITEWFYHDLAGIGDDQASPGFKRIVIRPNPVGDLAWVEARYESIRGPISVRWTHAGGEFGLQVAIPANATATVVIPARPGTRVREGGQDAAASEGVTLLRRDGASAVFAIESGRYAFTSQF